jgi:serine phosphatase RsbU (regulator of sigma subunit)
MKSLLKRRRKKTQVPAIELVASAFPLLRNAEIAAAFVGRRSAGDFYDSIRVGPSRVLFGLFDVAGRRQQNMDILLAAQRVFHETGSNLFAQDAVNETEALTELCLELNRTVIETAGGVHSSPAFAGCYNEDLGTVCYFNAGHTPGLVRHTSSVSELGATGLPLGLFSHTTSDARIIALQPGDALLLVSRGVVEVESKREEFGLERAEGALRSAELSSAHQLCVSVLDCAQRFASVLPANEDITALGLVRHPAG